MKTLVVYSSKTGNTKKVAEAVKSAMPEGCEIHPVENAPDPSDYDFVAMGFWVDKGLPDTMAQSYMKKIKGLNLGVFGTLGAWPDSGHARNCMEEALKMLESNNVLATFMCQGKVDPRLMEMMAKQNIESHAMTPERKARLEEAAKHPDDNDLKNAAEIFGKAIEELKAAMVCGAVTHSS